MAERAAFDPEELTYVLSHGAYWTGRVNSYELHRPGAVIVRDGRYWAILLCVLCGLRRNEAAQLRREHIRYYRDVWIIDLFNVDARVKRGSERIISIPQSVLDLGLLAEVIKPIDERRAVALAAVGEPMEDGEISTELTIGKVHEKTRLFPSLPYTEHDGSSGAALGFFTDVLEAVGLDGRFLSLHSARHTIQTFFENNGVPTMQVNDLLGHDERGDGKEQSKRYRKGPYIQQLKATLDLYPAPVDVALLRKLADAARDEDNALVARLQTELREAAPFPETKKSTMMYVVDDGEADA